MVLPIPAGRRRPPARSPGCSWWGPVCASPGPGRALAVQLTAPRVFSCTRVPRGPQPRTRGDPVHVSGILSLLSPSLGGAPRGTCGADPTSLHSRLCFLRAVRAPDTPCPHRGLEIVPRRDAKGTVCSTLFSSGDYRPELPRVRHLERIVSSIFWFSFLFFLGGGGNATFRLLIP